MAREAQFQRNDYCECGRCSATDDAVIALEVAARDAADTGVRIPLADLVQEYGGDVHWLAAHAELVGLHLNKSSTYGTGGDRFANFTAVAEKTGRPPEYYVAERMVEKLTRAMNQMDAGDPGSVKEWPDLAGLALCGEALRRRAACAGTA